MGGSTEIKARSAGMRHHQKSRDCGIAWEGTQARSIASDASVSIEERVNGETVQAWAWQGNPIQTTDRESGLLQEARSVQRRIGATAASAQSTISLTDRGNQKWARVARGECNGDSVRPPLRVALFSRARKLAFNAAKTQVNRCERAS